MPPQDSTLELGSAMTPSSPFQRAQVKRRLLEKGLSSDTATQLAPKLERVVEALPQEEAGYESLRAFFVPGRIEVLGKHTDYVGGSSLTCAPERGFCLGVAPSSDSALHVCRVATGETVDLELGPSGVVPGDHWARYPMTVIRRVRQNFDIELKGGHIAFTSTLPQAAGMSSSSAMIVAFFKALSTLNDLPSHPLYQDYLSRPEARAQYLGAIESGKAFGPLDGRSGVGTFGGSEDHTAILCSAPERLRQFRYCPTRLEAQVQWPDGHVFVVADSGVVAEKTGAEQDRYNRASRLATRAAGAWRSATGRDDPHLGAAVASDSFSPEQMREALQTDEGPFEPGALIRRFEHFYTENCQILPAAMDALRKQDLEAFGRQAERSQRAAEELLGNQVPETSFLAQEARRLGATAASAFGAGFGGAVWALVAEPEARSFRDAWASRYADSFPEPSHRAEFLVERPGPAAFRL